MQKNWKVTWQAIGGTEHRYFNDRMAAERFADAMRARTYHTNPKVEYIGSVNLSSTVLAMGPL